MARAERDLAAELSGLDSLEFALPEHKGRGARIWSAAWPKVLAIAIALLLWQGIVWSGWKPEHLLPGPAEVFGEVYEEFGPLMDAAGRTMQRGVVGFAVALVIGVLLGAAVARSRVLRAGIGSLITGLQTMPSVAWFPLALLLLKLSEGAILFVVVLGAAPSIANGLITGIDHIPPLLLRAGRVMGARGWAMLRSVVLPAALPAFAAGLKQGWAFAWRSLLAGELLTPIPGTFSLGQRLQAERDFNDATGLMAVMVVILVIGIVVDSLVFGTLDRKIRRRYGLIDEATSA